MQIITQILVLLVVVLYTLGLIFILFYSLTQANLVFTYLLHKKKYKANQQPQNILSTYPLVTVQLPVYNEQYVAERLIDCISRLDYPRDKLEIQILDDSTDETVKLIADKVAQLRDKINIKHLHRLKRDDYKAGALKAGLAQASGELIAIFDADFLPVKDFLLKTIPHFINENVGMVQTKWGWLNKNASAITKMQAFALDAHFSVEQVGRNRQNAFINFNGTAGVWRRSCITDAGNWQADTLTEDFDLSYRAQLKGWKFIYLENVTSPSELPPVMSAVKTQQYRWNKGGAETARKHLKHVILSKQPIRVKWLGAMHLLTSSIFLCVLSCAILSIPMLLIRHNYPAYTNVFVISGYFFISSFILGIMYLVACTDQYDNKWKGVAAFIQTMPVFLALSLGLSLHNALAVLEGFLGRKTPFVRTPKFNVTEQQDKWTGNKYLKKGFNKLTVAEAGLAIYFCVGILLAYRLNDSTFLPLHILLVAGYGTVVFYTLSQYFSVTRLQGNATTKPRLNSKNTGTKHLLKSLAIVPGISLLMSCTSRFNQRSYEVMLKGLLNHSVAEKSITQAKQEQECIFLDAREKNEYVVSHIKDAVWIGYKQFTPARLNLIDKNKKIIVYCSIGYRSEKVAEQLIKAGYDSVSNLYGGIFEWANQGNQVYNNTNNLTDEIHAYNHFWSKWLRVGKKIYD